MKELTKFQKIQLISSVIPYISFYFVAWITMIHLKKHKAKFKEWMFFSLIMFTACLGLFVNDALIHFETHKIINTIVTIIMLGAGNYFLIKLQMTYNKNE